MIKKYVTIDGVSREFTPEEYLEDENHQKKLLETEITDSAKYLKLIALKDKYKDPYEAIDKLCRHLKIDFETLED